MPRYRHGVGIMLCNARKQVFLGCRVDMRSDSAWQMPQGGVQHGESELDALQREMYEEVGLLRGHYDVVYSSLDYYAYSIPGASRNGLYDGQRQRWFLCMLTSDEACIDILHDAKNAEFCAWKWSKINGILTDVVRFKYDMYAGILREFTPIIARM